jgi:hypothetical protein
VQEGAESVRSEEIGEEVMNGDMMVVAEHRTAKGVEEGVGSRWKQCRRWTLGDIGPRQCGR